MIRNWVGVLIAMLILVTACKEGTKPKFSFRKKKPAIAFTEYSELPLDELRKAEVDSSTIELLQNFYHYFWEGNDLWGDFLVAQGNDILIEKYRGFANYQDSIPITPHKPIHLASISKNFTAMAILKLVENKKLKIHQKVNTILEKFPYPEITVFDLLTHRSGLGNYDYYAEQFNWIAEDSADFSNKRMYEMYAECKPALIFKPNTQHSYCNANYSFLALIVEKLMNKPFPKAMQEMVFQPLEMKDTYIFTKANQDTATISHYYNKRPWKWDPFDYIYGDNNVYSTALYILKYSQDMFTS